MKTIQHHIYFEQLEFSTGEPLWSSNFHPLPLTFPISQSLRYPLPLFKSRWICVLILDKESPVTCLDKFIILYNLVALSLT